MLSELQQLFASVASVFDVLWFILLPVTFYYIFRSLFGRHNAIQHLMRQNPVLLEIIPPRDVEKSPKIAEKFFDTLTSTDKGPNIWDKYLNGYQNPFFSFEIVGIEGVAHFYVQTPAFFRDYIESAIYAQYPDAEIVEVHDYTQDVPAVIPNKEWDIWGTDFALMKHDAYPIKTYKYFQEDVTGKMIDPLSVMMEQIGALGPGQQLWLQYIVQAERPNWFPEAYSAVDAFLGRDKKRQSFWVRVWKDLVDVFLATFSALNKPPEFAPFEEAQSDDQPVEFRLTPGEKQTLTALEENVGKGMFEVKMRTIYVGRRDGFIKSNVSGVMGATIKQFSDNNLNTMIPYAPSKTDADYVFKKTVIASRQHRLLERYRDRDNSGKTFHMSTEELATVFHLPDMSVVSPSVRFVDSRRGGAPGNLPFH